MDQFDGVLFFVVKISRYEYLLKCFSFLSRPSSDDLIKRDHFFFGKLILITAIQRRVKERKKGGGERTLKERKKQKGGGERKEK